MTDKELKKKNRKELLELLLVQTQRADRLEAELAEANRKLADRTLAQSEAGSIAEAALRLNGVYESAESAVAQYVENIRQMSENQRGLAEWMEAEARRKADAIVAEAEQKCAAREAAAERKLDGITEQLQKIYRQKLILDDLFDEIAVKKDE